MLEIYLLLRRISREYKVIEARVREASSIYGGRSLDSFTAKKVE